MGILSYHSPKHTQVTHSARHFRINTFGMILKIGTVGIQRNVHSGSEDIKEDRWRRKRWTTNHRKYPEAKEGMALESNHMGKCIEIKLGVGEIKLEARYEII